MHRLIRQTVYLLLVSFLISATGWAASVVDVHHHDAHATTVQITADASGGHPHAMKDAADPMCDFPHGDPGYYHTCDMSGHLIGVFPQYFPLVLNQTGTQSYAWASPALRHRSPDNPFRPPRSILHA